MAGVEAGENLSPQLPPRNRAVDLFPLPSPLLTVGGRLSGFGPAWELLTEDKLVLSVVQEVSRLELMSNPPLSRVPIPFRLPASPQKASALLGEINALLEKQAVEELDPTSLSQGFYSPIFLVPKKDGRFRPVFNLKPLNLHIQKQSFKMKTQRDISSALHMGDWAVSIDLKDAYFHVPIHRDSRHLLRFAVSVEGLIRVFQFKTLPFGLSSAPRVFTRMILPIGHHVHMLAMFLLQYFDDWLLKDPDRQSLMLQRDTLLEITQRVGWIPNLDKSILEPTQRLVHIGTEYHLDTGMMYPPMTRIEKIERKISTLFST